MTKNQKKMLQFAVKNGFRFKSLQKGEPVECIDVLSNDRVFINLDDGGCAYEENMIEILQEDGFQKALSQGLKNSQIIPAIYVSPEEDEKKLNLIISEIKNDINSAISNDKIEVFISQFVLENIEE